MLFTTVNVSGDAFSTPSSTQFLLVSAYTVANCAHVPVPNRLWFACVTVSVSATLPPLATVWQYWIEPFGKTCPLLFGVMPIVRKMLTVNMSYLTSPELKVKFPLNVLGDKTRKKIFVLPAGAPLGTETSAQTRLRPKGAITPVLLTAAPSWLAAQVVPLSR